MSSHTPTQLLGRQPRGRPNQHRLPPLLVQPTPSVRTPPQLLSTAVSRDNLLLGHQLKSTDASRRQRFSSRNYCSVAAVGSRVNADTRMSSCCNGQDSVSYAVEHCLPKLLNDMLDDMLRERPETDVDAWMMQWFERVYLQQQRGEIPRDGTHHPHPQGPELRGGEHHGGETPSYHHESTSGVSSAGGRGGSHTRPLPVSSCGPRLSPSVPTAPLVRPPRSAGGGITDCARSTDHFGSVLSPRPYHSALHAYSAVSHSGFPVGVSGSSSSSSSSSVRVHRSPGYGNCSPPMSATGAQRIVPSPQQTQRHSVGVEPQPQPPLPQQQPQQHSVTRVARGGEMRFKVHSAHLTDMGSSDAFFPKPV